MSTINIWSILVASIVSFIISAFWYSPALFGKQWMALNKMGNKDIDEAKMGGIAKLYVAQFILAFVTFCILGFALSEIGTVGVLNGATVGFFAWIGFYATAAIGSMLWEQKPLKLLLITSGGMLVNLVISGAIIAGWR